MELIATEDPIVKSSDEAYERFKAYLKKEGLKYTNQRELIMEEFLATDDHLTAEELYNRVNLRNPSIGFSTVYRTLHVIVRCGVAREREFSAGRKFYEHIVGESKHHHHLICTECGTIVEFHCPDEIEEAQFDIAREHGFILTAHTHELFGLCSKCQQLHPAKQPQ